MAHNNQNLVLENTETDQFLELQAELNKDGTRRSLSQVVAYTLRVAMANAKAAEFWWLSPLRLHQCRTNLFLQVDQWPPQQHSEPLLLII